MLLSQDDVSSIDRLHTKDTTVPCVPKGKHLTGGRDKQRIVYIYYVQVVDWQRRGEEWRGYDQPTLKSTTS